MEGNSLQQILRSVLMATQGMTFGSGREEQRRNYMYLFYRSITLQVLGSNFTKLPLIKSSLFFLFFFHITKQGIFFSSIFGGTAFFKDYCNNPEDLLRIIWQQF